MASKIPMSAIDRHTQATKGGARRNAAEAQVRTAASQMQVNAKTEAFCQLKEGSLQKNLKRKPHKGNTGRETELQNQIQRLEANFEELERNLAHYKDHAGKMEQQNSDLQMEKCEIRKQLESCLLLLAAGNIDPVLGQKIADTKSQNEELQCNVMNISRGLLEELGTFNEKMSTHRQQLEEVVQKMSNLKRSKEQHIVEREQFSLELEEMEKAMECVEALLLEEM